MSDHEIIEMRHAVGSPEEDRQETLAALSAGLEESGIGRRPLVRNSLLGAIGLVILPAVVVLRDLGPTPKQVAKSGVPGAGLEATIWSEGMRVVRDVVGTPIRASDLEIGDLVNAEPAALFEVDEEGEPIIEGAEAQVVKSKAAVILVRMQPEDIHGCRGPRGVVGRRHPLLLQDLHARGVPDLAVRAHHPQRAVPLPPVDLRPRGRRSGHLRPGRPCPAAAAADG